MASDDHRKGSFNYRTMDNKIKNVLHARSLLDNTVQMAMPFVKATTTLRHADMLGEGNIGFTLGLHAIHEDVEYENIYSSQNGSMPLIGYTYDKDGRTQRVYAKDLNDNTVQVVTGVFDKRAKLFSNTNGFTRTPPPGITQATIGRNKNGLLALGQLEISIPSLVQLESLHRTFLVPGLGMVLEWGQQFADEGKTLTDFELPNISEYMFPWHDSDELMPILDKLARRQLGLPEILQDYVYPSNGQYAWMFGRVANFSVKSNSDGSFNATVKIIGQSEDSWAYSTKSPVIPLKDPSAKFHCAANPNSVFGYFTNTAPGELNFKTLLDYTANEKNKSPWLKHVILFKQGNQKAGEPTETEQKPTISNLPFADSEDAYFMTWRFFVNVVLNDAEKGLKGIYTKGLLTDDEINNVALLLPYLTTEDITDDRKNSVKTPGPTYIDDPMECYVGFNENLRSVDPSTMIIVNEKAAKLAEKNPQYDIPTSGRKLLEPGSLSKQFLPLGTFEESAKQPDRGLLSTGIWLNHKAVVESMVGGDTIMRGIVNLLERMNQATLNYWQLTIDTAEPDGPNGLTHSYNHMVVDGNFHDSSEIAVSKFLDNVHTFNKYVRQDTATGKLVGSELIDCSIDLSLPKRLFSQIATMGLVQPEDLQKVQDSGKTKDQLQEEAKEAKTQGPDLTDIQSPKLESEPANDRLRRLFAITVLDPTSDKDQSPDLTVLPKTQRKELAKMSSMCGKGNSQLTAQTAGNSNRPVNLVVQEMLKDKSTEETNQLKKDTDAWLKKNEGTCKKCEPCLPKENLTDGSLKAWIEKQQWSAAFVSYVMQTSGTPFPGAQMHSTYADAVRKANNEDWQALDPAKTKIQPGDIIVFSHAGDLTYKSAAWAGVEGHGDIVVEINNGAVAIGGNVNDAVGISNYGLDSNGYVTKSTVYTILRPASSYVAQIVSTARGQLDAWRSISPGLKEWEPAAFPTLNNYYRSVNMPEIPTTGVVPSTGPSTDKKCDESVYKGAGNGDMDKGKKACYDCEKQIEMKRQIEIKNASVVEQLDIKIRQFYGLRDTFRYVEVFPEYMVAQISSAANGNFANAFGASPGALSISGDLVMPGINGIRVGELFWIDRIPTFYKAYGAFQVMSLEDTIDINGWKTTLHARFNFLGEKWKDAMAKKLAPADNNVKDPEKPQSTRRETESDVY
jgi:plastocyanin